MDGRDKKQVVFAIATIISFVAGFLAGYIVRGMLRNLEKSDGDKPGAGVNIEISELVAKREEIDQAEVENCEMWVDLSGAVVNPGVYCIEEGEILENVLQKAGGFYSDLYAYKFVSQQMNRAKKLQDEEKIYVPFEDDVVCKLKQLAEDPSGVNEKEEKSEGKDLQDNDLKKAMCVSINNASQEELESLSGVGPSTAQKIIEGRPYGELKDLLNVSGIGDSTFGKLEPYICL
ncbi:hypothetical protein GF357_04165 [Candidatus Dojkabacteria bacterium]|nr:hypothetical protein [Candidatus Dojkabacteria bacterium]